MVERSRNIVQEQNLILELDLRAVAFAHGFYQELGIHLWVHPELSLLTSAKDDL